MKKSIALILAVLMMATMLFTGCSDNTTTTPENGEEANNEVVAESIVLTTGGNTGTYYGYGMAMSTILSEKTGIAFDVQPSGASKANIQAIQLGDANMAVVQNDVMYYAYTGTDLFAGAQTQDFAALAVLYPELCQIIATKESGIKTVADLKGKNVSVGDAGSGVEFNARQILEIYGIDMDKDINKQNLGFGPSADALKDGKIDAFFCVAGIPTTAITDLAMAKKNRIGAKAENFDFLIRGGKRGKLDKVKGEYIILLLGDPDCDICSKVKNEITTSNLLSGMIDSGRIVVLSVCVEGKTDSWLQTTLPDKWINACDDKQLIYRKRLYDIPGLPVLYLLDKEHRVLMKNIQVTHLEQYFSSR